MFLICFLKYGNFFFFLIDNGLRINLNISFRY